MTYTRTQVVLLGTGTPNAEPERHGTALAVIVDDVPYLVDFGPGVVRRAAAAHAKGITALALPRLTTAFLTHLHSDHTAGYPDLILTPWVLERTTPLTVYGPTGLQHMTEHVLAAYAADIHERLHGLEPANETGYQVQVHEFTKEGLVYQDERITVEAIRVQHGSWPAYAYKFSTPERVILFSGDTAPVPALREHPCDLLIHEVYSVAGFQHKSPQWKAYHRSVHTSTHEVGDLAAHLQPETLVLVHQLHWGTSDDDLVREVQERYAGTVVSGKDLDVF